MTSQEVATIALGAGIAAFGWIIALVVNSVNGRLDKLEECLQVLVSQGSANSTRQDINTQEINKLRDTVHELRSEVVALDAIQSRCKSCSPRG